MRLVTVFLILLLCSVPAFSQSTKSKTGAPDKAKQAPSRPAPPPETSTPENRADTRAYVSEPFDLTLERLPAGYAGHGCSVIAEALKKAKTQKDEFETTDAYTKRIDQVKTAPLVGTVTLTDLMAFMPNERFGVLQRYDADAARLQVTILLLDSYITKPTFRSVLALVMDVRNTQNSSYAASNIYGKTVNVNQIVRDVCGLIFDKRNLGILSRMEIQTAFSVEPEEARSLREELGVLYVGSLGEPYYAAYSKYRKPTIDRPIETVDGGPGLVLQLKQVWLFNRATGKVYARIDG